MADAQGGNKEGAKVSEARTSGGPLGIQFPADPIVLQEARRLVADRTTRIEDLALCASQDPVIAMELLHVANAMFFAGGRSPISVVKTAMVRLGADVVLEVFDKIAERPQLADPNVGKWFEMHRLRGRRASIVATILAEALARPLVDEIQVAALFIFTGDMLAVAHLRERYAKLAEMSSRASLLCKLSQDLRFNVEAMGISYVKRQGIPESIVSALDRDSRPRAQDKLIMKPICFAASEFVDAFDIGRIDKFSPGKTIPPKSALRSLQFTDAQYLRIYERIAEYLYSVKMIEDRKMAGQGGDVSPLSISVTASQPAANPSPNTSLEEEITQILSDTTPPPPAATEPKREVSSGFDWGEDSDPAEETEISEWDEDIDAGLDAFSLGEPDGETKAVPRVVVADKVTKAPPPTIHTKSGSAFLSTVSDVLKKARTSEELLSEILAQLISPGPFEKAALLVVSKDRSVAMVVAARGPVFTSGQKITITDPLHPVAQCFSKVQSFGLRNSKVSPFGSKAFAVAPIDADHDTPVALYADCGADGALTFEARRIFRNVVEILNVKLPTLPGGIPMEVAKQP